MNNQFENFVLTRFELLYVLISISPHLLESLQIYYDLTEFHWFNCNITCVIKDPPEETLNLYFSTLNKFQELVDIALIYSVGDSIFLASPLSCFRQFYLCK